MANEEDAVVVESTIDSNQVELAVKALFAHIQKQKESKKQLFEESEVFSLTLALKKIPKASLKPYLIPLQHPINKDVEVCLFSSLPGKEAKAVLEEKSVQGITKVISMEKLKKNYKTFGNRRELCAAYDVFLCDNKLFSMMPRYLGKVFYSRKKEPLPVNFNRDLKAEVQRAVLSSRMFLGRGPCSNIKVGKSDQTAEQVKENIIGVTNFMAENIPGGWANVKALYLKTATSISLPIYAVLPEYEGNSEEEAANEAKAKEEAAKKKQKKSRKRPLLAVQDKTNKDKEVKTDHAPKVKKSKKLPKRTKPILKKMGVR